MLATDGELNQGSSIHPFGRSSVDPQRTVSDQRKDTPPSDHRVEGVARVARPDRLLGRILYRRVYLAAGPPGAREAKVAT